MENNEREIYTGFVSLRKALDTVVLTSKSEKAHVTRQTIRWETYKKIVKWMKPYAARVSFNEKKGEFEVSGKPVMPSESELRNEFDITPYALSKLVGEDDTVFVLCLKKNIGKKEEERHAEVAGLYKGVNYVILKSLYPKLVDHISRGKPIKSNV